MGKEAVENWRRRAMRWRERKEMEALCSELSGSVKHHVSEK